MNREPLGIIPSYVSEILKLLESSGYDAFVAGGAVRDIVLGKNPHDYDIATSAKPSETVEVFKAAGIDFFDNAARHGTVTAVMPEGNLEITTFREDGSYTDLRRPDDVVFKNTIEEDVRRRDFTINAMYMDSAGRVYDPEGGQDDCAKSLIRTVGDPELHFGEDVLRILRGVRFSASLGFEIEQKTFLAMEAQAHTPCTVAMSRAISKKILCLIVVVFLIVWSCAKIRKNSEPPSD